MRIHGHRVIRNGLVGVAVVMVVVMDGAHFFQIRDGDRRHAPTFSIFRESPLDQGMDIGAGEGHQVDHANLFGEKEAAIALSQPVIMGQRSRNAMIMLMTVVVACRI